MNRGAWHGFCVDGQTAAWLVSGDCGAQWETPQEKYEESLVFAFGSAARLRQPICCLEAEFSAKNSQSSQS